MTAKSIQICGTGSSVGKSVIVAGLCRIFLQDGFLVAPFKAQNMSLNSYITKEGGEIGRAQAMQAQACRLIPSSDMNPILLKPTSDVGSQVIVKGKPFKNMSAAEYKKNKLKLKKDIISSFNNIKKDFDLIVIEGAGSPAEINLKSSDLVNMAMAKTANAPVILVGDIDKGGVFASFVGTIELLTKKERKMIKGFIINKFRGDKNLLKEGIDYLERKTKIKVLGVIPYFKDIKLPQEDSVFLEEHDNNSLTGRKLNRKSSVNIAIIKLPHISNFTDFDLLENEPDANLYYVEDKKELDNADIIVIPGTKNTISDLIWLKEKGIKDKILSILNFNKKVVLIGICGGYQMLGEKIRDLSGIESKNKEIEGLSILPIITSLQKTKVLGLVRAKDINAGFEISGYEIHHGKTKKHNNLKSAFNIFEQQGRKIKRLDGAVSNDGRIWGTYIHGVFDMPVFRRDFLNRIRKKKGLPPILQETNINLDNEFDKLADLLRKNLDVHQVKKILREGLRGYNESSNNINFRLYS